jgi:hypothetical protein
MMLGQDLGQRGGADERVARCTCNVLERAEGCGGSWLVKRTLSDELT